LADADATPIPLYTESPLDPALDVAVSHALLRRAVTAGEVALRLWRPPPALSFGRLDLLSPTSDRAIETARAAGLTPVRRLAGGRAAPIGPSTVCLGWASPGGEMSDMQLRYEVIAGVLIDALGELGVKARVGELSGEWCPGSWSVIVGEAKVSGLAQRVVRGGAWAEAVLVVGGSRTLGIALDEVQRALGVDWSPSTFAGLTDEWPALTRERVTDALLAALASRWTVRLMRLEPSAWKVAEALRQHHAL
jgi:lipoate-protein ligase A